MKQLGKHFWKLIGFIVIFWIELNETWTCITLVQYENHLANFATNYINVCFFTHHICDREKLVLGQLPLDDCPREKLPLRIIANNKNCSWENCPPHRKFSPKINSPHSSKFPSKSTTRVNLANLCIVYEHYCLRLMNHSRIKKWFTSIYLLQILTRPCRTSLIREHLSPNAPWFSYSRMQNYTFLKKKKIELEKNTCKNTNNDKIICIWYLSSKWPVCRSIVNQTTAVTSRTKPSTLLKTNIFKHCALFCNKVAKMHL